MPPRWLPIARDYAATRKRFTLQGSLREMLSGILPTYQVERNWPGDQLDLWGVNGISNIQIPNNGAMDPLHISGSLHNISDSFEIEDRKELLVWRITAHVGFTIVDLAPAGALHLFSPGIGYNPEAIPATGPLPNTGTFLPFLQPQTTDQVLRFPTAGHLDVGYNTGVQVVSIGGSLNLGIGPTMHVRENAARTAAGPESEFGLPGLDAPPYRVQPGRKLTVQSINAFAFDAFTRLDVSFYYSERGLALGL
ncbi:MAG: hypothetical protein V3T07_01770 [Myxococcota bacterium]